jgi:hypothetical protein
MKWDYWNNWKREVNENYLVTTGEIMHYLENSDYTIKYKKPFILEYLRNKIKTAFDYEIKSNTHIKIILELL